MILGPTRIEEIRALLHAPMGAANQLRINHDLVRDLLDTVDAARKENERLEARVTALEDPQNLLVPYWAWIMLINFLSDMKCFGWAENTGNGIDCLATESCITEWCPACVAKHYKEQHLVSSKKWAAECLRNADAELALLADQKGEGT